MIGCDRALMSYLDRESAPGPKRLLALDGGGMRGALTLEVLGALEAMLRQETDGDDSFVLGDWFDYIAGTSTGAIIAAALAWGMPVRRIKELYRTLGGEMFRKPMLPRRFWYRYRADALSATLREVFGSATLGDARLRTLLMMVLWNETTDSPWPLSNATGARFNDRSRPDCNLDLPLWQLVRGSTAAPIYFPAEVIRVGGRRVVFADGGLTSFNNPAFQLFLMATLSAYGLNWPAGVDSLLLVSVGTGYHPNAGKNLKLSRLHVLHNVRSAPSALMLAALMQQDALCRVFGRCLVGGEIDSELADLKGGRDPGGRELFTYLRYNADLSAAGLSALGLGRLDSTQLRRLDSVGSIADLEAVGRAVVERDLRAEHYRPFLRAPNP
jgi:patatin-like phospholipase/acyl hydrolase